MCSNMAGLYRTKGAKLISSADFQKSEDELLLSLAEQLVAAGQIRLSSPLDDNSKRDRARRWLDAYLANLRLSICADPRVVAYLKDENIQNQVEIAAVLVDCLSASTVNVPVGTLAVLLVKGRLRSLCTC